MLLQQSIEHVSIVYNVIYSEVSGKWSDTIYSHWFSFVYNCSYQIFVLLC